MCMSARVMMMLITVCARDSKARKLARGIAQERDVSLHRLAPFENARKQTMRYMSP